MDAPCITTLRPRSLDDVAAAVRGHPRLIPRGAGTKWGAAGLPGPSRPGEAAGAAPPGDEPVLLDTTGLAGVVDYDPAEFTVTARAGTRLAELAALLDRHGQYLPFDPLLVDAGATLGGTVATGVSGPCRLRYGGVRDFVLGITLVDGTGRVARGGGRVVKNAAGYDLPKLFCGSQGRLGVIAELTLKVFPKPEAFATARIEFDAVDEAAAAARALYRSPLEPHAIELAGPGILSPRYTLLVRGGGPASARARWLDRVEQVTGRRGERLLGGAGPGAPPAAPPASGSGCHVDSAETGAGGDEDRLWRQWRELAWAGSPQRPRGRALLRLYTRPAAIEVLDRFLAARGALRLFSQAGSAAWALFPDEPDWGELAVGLKQLGVAALCWWGGPPGMSFLVPPAGAAVARAVKEVFDPQGRFPPLGWDGQGDV